MSLALHMTIAETIREQIRAGELTVGEALPSESQLCAQWNASRGPVRQALATLRAEGVIGGGRGKPPVVRTASLAQPFDTLLSFSAWAHSIGRTPGQRTLELALRPADDFVSSVLGVAVGRPVVQVLRLRFLDAEPTMLERSTFIEPIGRALFDFDCDSGSLWAHLQSRGARFSTATHVIDAVAADPDDAQYLDVAVGAPLLRQQRSARDVDGALVEYSDDRYLPGIVSFTLENTIDSRTALMRKQTP